MSEPYWGYNVFVASSQNLVRYTEWSSQRLAGNTIISGDWLIIYISPDVSMLESTTHLSIHMCDGKAYHVIVR